MQKTESIKNLTKALQVFHLKMQTIKFDAVNPHFRSKYASLSHILEEIKDPLLEAGLTIIQLPVDENGLTTMLIHSESGEYISSTYYMKPDKVTPQGYGSVLTYQRRYCISGILNLSFEEDDDANAATDNSKPIKKYEDDGRKWLNKGTDMYAKAIDKLKSGETTIEKIKLAFKLSKEVEKSLIEESKN
jgi:hypothetical protein